MAVTFKDGVILGAIFPNPVLFPVFLKSAHSPADEADYHLSVQALIPEPRLVHTSPTE